MTRLRPILILALFLWAACPRALAGDEGTWVIDKFPADNTESVAHYDFTTGIATIENGALVKYNGAVLTADKVSVDQATGEAVASGHVRVQREEQVWTADKLRFNFKTYQASSDHFRTGKGPFFAGGDNLRGLPATNHGTIDLTNSAYTARHAYLTTDDISQPVTKIRAERLVIIPGKRLEAHNAVLYIGDIPVFYAPYYSRDLGDHPNSFNFTPGYRSIYGPFILGNYTWYLSPELNGILHLDYREKRGVGLGPDFDYHLGRWGDGTLRYYYTHDNDAGTNEAGVALPSDRQRSSFTYLAAPYTNVTMKSIANWQSDTDVNKDFFGGDYRHNPQAPTWFEANKAWNNFSLDLWTQPQVNTFFETVERLPDLRLSAFRQQVGETPVYYQSESSAGFYQHLYAGTNSPYASPTNSLQHTFYPFYPTDGLVPPNYSAGRLDTFQQITLPQTFFGWLNLTPRVGGRLTYYSEVDVNGTGTTLRTNSNTLRGIFNTGAELSFKASALWADAHSRSLDIDGLRHVIEPSANYVFVPRPNYLPSQLPQFDTQLPSLRMLPIEFPEYNSIDDITNQNVLRLGLSNKLQTKRDGKLDDVVNWRLFTDWRVQTGPGVELFSDVYSDLTIRPRTWITFESQLQVDPNNGQWHMVLDTITFQPNNIWSLTLGQFYMPNDYSASQGFGSGNNIVMGRFYYRINENWGLRAAEQFNVQTGEMQEQYYTIYRDMRSWTAALTGGVLNNGSGPRDYTISFSFSIKAFPKFGVGQDTAQRYSLLGYD
ncbi:MAG: LPS assembly protein LptD [Verrucomicrobiota bacterium]